MNHQFQAPERRLEIWSFGISPSITLICEHSQGTSQLIILFKACYLTSAILCGHPGFSLAIFEMTFQYIFKIFTLERDNMKNDRKPIFKGTCTALITPFRGGEIDFKALKNLIEFQML